ncbi:hypothetical protein BKP43_33630 [Variovorax boronicumulans]|nr:hypothetical protein BKP43_33630 [Variovorax boronicumulans]
MRGRLRSKGAVVVEGKHIGVVKRVLTEIEVGQLIRWLPHCTAIVDDALTLYFWTCTRGAEICAMEAREITQEVHVRSVVDCAEGQNEERSASPGH